MLPIASSHDFETMTDALTSVNWRTAAFAQMSRRAIGPDQTQEKFPVALLLRVFISQTHLVRLEPSLARETAEKPEDPAPTPD